MNAKSQRLSYLVWIVVAVSYGILDAFAHSRTALGFVMVGLTVLIIALFALMLRGERQELSKRK